MKTLLTLLIVSWGLSVQALQLIPFRSEDHKLKVYRMDSVLIMADSAYIISGLRAQLLNDKLAELHRAYALSAQLIDVNAALLSKVMEIEQLVLELVERMQQDQALVSASLSELLTELDSHIRELEATNLRLDEQNAVLEKQLLAMESTIKGLKRTLRKLRWRNAVEKVLIGLLGVGVGIVVGSR